jgi:AcrR family transcriptional regulator
MFMQMGIKQVSMDDLSAKLKISKKTLYNNYKDKGSLVDSAVFHHFNEIESKLSEISQSNDNPINKMLNGARLAIEQLAKVNPKMIEDLEKYHPETHAKLEEYRIESINKHITHNINEGRTLGLYRSDFDASVITPLFVEMLFHLTHGLAAGKSKFQPDSIKELVSYHLHGICTQKGLLVLDKTLQNEQ